MEDRFGYGAIVRAMRPEEREEMLGLLLAGATLRDAAAACGVSLKTSFSMRHRPCEVMASMPPAFEAGPGCPVEADETLVPDSLSGNHSRSAGFPCPAPHAGAGATGPLPA